MLKFEHTRKEDVLRFRPWFQTQKMHIADLSLGFQFMWHKVLAPDFAFFGDTLILRELYSGKYYFYYPMSLSGSHEAELEAIAEIERFCRDNDMRLHFTNVPKSRLAELVFRYGSSVSVSDNRRWRDYLYPAEDFRTYAGKRHAGQRNHVHKFTKMYPDWSFRRYTDADEDAVVAFLKEYESVQLEKGDRIADEEIAEVYAILPQMKDLGMCAGILEAGGKIVAFSAGEICGDMLVIHIEKALRGYDGAYPMIAQQFALAFSGEADFINRMDDAGDLGLRKSKLQYLPCELVSKYNVIAGRAIDAAQKLPEIETERLLLRPVGDEDADRYAELASDVERNRFWGYDYRETMPKNAHKSWFLESAREDFHHRFEMPLGIYSKEGELLGEVVLHRFGYHAEAEIGVRLFEASEGNGYAQEAVRAYTEYAFTKLHVERMEAKCYLENERSRRMLLQAGMREEGKDDTFFRFCRTPEM